MGNFCCECNNKNIDDGNFKSGKISFKEESNKKSKIYKITSCDTKINENVNSNLLELHKNNDDNTTQNMYENNIPSNPPVLPKQIIPENIINSTKKLKLTILQSKYLEEGKEYIINAGGLIGSKRNIQDGVTYFGDISVIIYKYLNFYIIYIYRQIIKMISNSQKKNQKMHKVVQK